jgi:hypothetical protein
LASSLKSCFQDEDNIRFDLQRHKQLKSLFTPERITDLWRALVKEQMRALDIKDLHDYYDFNFAIEGRAEVIAEKVLSGQYRAETPLVYRLEKKFGVCRHMMIPSPSDALVFQLLTDVLYADIINAQPSKGAYYARDRHTLRLPHQHKGAKSYPWFVLWPKFQKDIWNFTKSSKYLVTTDLTNYFDNIGLRELRHVISSIARTEEVYLDLLFALIEDLSWKPDYLPASHKGLPTINIEAIRLLAHALLFEIDYVLKQRTNNSFVRWMDDINFGVNDPRTGSLILGELNDVLKSRGLALNLAKTSILTATKAQQHFLFRENLLLDKLARRGSPLRSEKAKARFANNCATRLHNHLKNCRARNKEKITKRYLRLLRSLAAPVALKDARDIFKLEPALRPTVLDYLSRLPFGASVARTFLQLVLQTEFFDDATLYKYIGALVDWQVPFSKQGAAFIDKIRSALPIGKTAFGWLCEIQLLAKYGEPHEVLTTYVRARKVGAKEAFFARQGMAVLPRSLGINPERVRGIWSTEVSTGASDSASVANNLLRFLDAGFPNRNDRVYFYLFPKGKQRPYPLPKFLLLCVLAASEASRNAKTERPEVLDHLVDPWYRHWIEAIHPGWFPKT